MRKFTSQHKRRAQPTASLVNFNSFTFVDNLTNSKIMLKDAQEHYRKHLHPRPQNDLQFKQREVNNLNNCVALLKTTKSFQMDSLRHKLFRSAYHTRHPTLTDDQQQHIQQTTRGLKKMIASSISQINRKELQQWLQDPTKGISPQIMGLQKLSGHKLTKSNLVHLIQLSTQPTQQKENEDPIASTPESAPIQFKQQKELRDKIEHNLASLRANNMFLVQPDPQHELYEKLYSACNKKHSKMKRTATPRRPAKLIEEGVFKLIKAGRKVDELEAKVQLKKQKSEQPEDERELIHAVENNLFFDMEFLLNSKKSLIHCRDKKGNNLLHIAAKSRNAEFFQYLLKKSHFQSLQAKNNLGKTPMDLAKLYGVQGIVEVIHNYSPFG